MAKKQKRIEAKRLPTKQQLSKWERQKKLQRMIFIAGGVFLVIIVAFVGYGYYDAQVKPFTQKVMKVNETVIDMNYYLEWLGIFLPGVDSARASLTAEMVLGSIMRNELVLQRAPTLGVTVNDGEIESELTKQQLPSNRVYRDAYASKLLTDRLLAVYFDPKVPTTARQANIQAMFLESAEIANEILGKINNNESFLQLAKRYSTEEFTKDKSGEVGWVMDGLANLAGGKFSNSLLDDIAFSTAPGIISKPTYDTSVMKEGGYWLLEVTERRDKDNSSHMRGILLGSESEAVEVKTKLKGGADFAALAKEKSQHVESKSFGGDLGWIRKGSASDAVVKVAFELPVGTLSEPILDKSVRTSGGYWLVKVLERDDNRQIDKEAREQLKANAFQNWVEEQGKSSTVERYLDEKQKAWAVEYTLKKAGGKKK